MNWLVALQVTKLEKREKKRQRVMEGNLEDGKG